MGVLPVKKLVITMSLPMMISMIVQALYNVVDSIFVSQINENALTAVTLAFPMQSLMIAVGSGTGVGINALLSRSLGEKRYVRSDAAANMGILLTIFSYLLFLITGLFLSGTFIMTQTKEPEILEYGTTYLKIVSCLSAGLFCQMTFERLLQSTGRTFYSMISQATGAIVNIIFDPILIFGLFGLPRMGVAGAAFATVLGQMVAGTLGFFMNIRHNHDINLSIGRVFNVDLSVIKEIYSVGIPSILMISIGSVMTYLMNRILIVFSTTATAVFGAYFKLQSFFFMPVFGLNNGVIPVLAYNYGAKKKDRINETLKFSIFLAVCIMLVGTFVFEVFPDKLLGFFNASPEMLQIGIPALRIMGMIFPLAGACIAMGSIFQAFSESIYSLIISVGRQLVLLIPAAWLLSLTGSVNNVWWAFPIAEAGSLTLSLIFFRRLMKKVSEQLSDNSEQTVPASE